MAFKFCLHFKLIQHQYKILTMIATSKYIRYKMKIETSHECSHCLANNIETLKHMYLLGMSQKTKNLQNGRKFYND